MRHPLLLRPPVGVVVLADRLANLFGLAQQLRLLAPLGPPGHGPRVQVSALGQPRPPPAYSAVSGEAENVLRRLENRGIDLVFAGKVPERDPFS